MCTTCNDTSPCAGDDGDRTGELAALLLIAIYVLIVITLNPLA